MNKETQGLNDTLGQIDLIDNLQDILSESRNTLSSQVHKEHSPRQLTSWVTCQASVNLRILKSYQASFPTTKL